MRRKRFEPIAILGLIGTIVLHGGVLIGVLLYRRALLAEEKAPPPLGSYVVAKLVRLGKPRDSRRLPNKIVPQESTRKEETIDLSADANDSTNTSKKDKRDVKVSDKLRNALDRAELLAQGEKEIEGEGSPDGVAGGTASSAQDGDPYITRIADIWNRNWSLPAIIPAEQARSLYVLVVLRIDQEGNIQFPIDVRRRSGNPHFDNSIIAAWGAIKRIPVPPVDRLASILANGLRLKLTWKGLQ